MKANDIIQIEPFHHRGTTYIRLTNDEHQSVGAEACFILDYTENTEEKPYRGDNDD